MSDEKQDGRATAGVELVRRRNAGDSRPDGRIMTVTFEKEAGVSFEDGGRLLFGLVVAIKEALATIDPALSFRWKGEGFRVGSREADAAVQLSALGFEPVEGVLDVSFAEGSGDPCIVLVDGPEIIKLGTDGDRVRLWRDKRGTK